MLDVYIELSLMALSYSSLLLLLAGSAALLLLSPCHASYHPEVVYVTCGSTYYVNQDVRIRLTDSAYLNRNTECHMTLMPTAGSGTHLVARFIRYYMSIRYVHEYGPCTQEGILLQGHGGQSFFGPTGYCQSAKPDARSYDLGSTGLFGYHTGNANYLSTPDVELLVTEVRDKASGNTDCPSGYFDCHMNNYCIDEDLTCNGYDDCGNDRDEIEGCGLTAALIGGIVAAIIFAFIVIIIVTAFLIRRHRRRVVYIQYK